MTICTHPVRSTVRALALTALLALCGCVFPVIPIPPPAAVVVTAQCTDVDCPPDGKIVTVKGRVPDGATVLLVNRSRSLPDGRQYMASTVAATVTPSDAGAGDGGTADTDNFRIDLLPVHTPGEPVVISRSGDMLELFYFSADPASTSAFRRSGTAFITVP